MPTEPMAPISEGSTGAACRQTSIDDVMKHYEHDDDNDFSSRSEPKKHGIEGPGGSDAIPFPLWSLLLFFLSAELENHPKKKTGKTKTLQKKKFFTRHLNGAQPVHFQRRCPRARH